MKPLIIIALLAGTLLATIRLDHRPIDSLARPLSTIATSMSGWSASDDPPLDDAVLKILVPTSYLSRTYHRGSDALNLFVAYYSQQRAGESMHSPKNCLPGSGWEVIQSGTTQIPVNGQLQVINNYVVQNAGERRIVFYWYQSRERIIAREALAKILLVHDALVGAGTGGSLVRIIIPNQPKLVPDTLKFASAVAEQMRLSLGR